MFIPRISRLYWPRIGTASLASSKTKKRTQQRKIKILNQPKASPLPYLPKKTLTYLIPKGVSSMIPAKHVSYDKTSKKKKKGDTVVVKYKKEHKREKCPEPTPAPVAKCTVVAISQQIDSPVIPLFASELVTVSGTVDLTATSLAPLLGISIGGTADAPILFITLDVAGIVTTISLSSVAGVPTASLVVGPLPATLTSTISFSGVPILGAEVGTLSSTQPELVPGFTSVQPLPEQPGVSVVTGVLRQSISYNAIVAAIPATTLSLALTALLSALLSDLLGDATLVTAIPGLDPATTTALTILLAVLNLPPTATVSQLTTSLITVALPDLTLALQNSLAISGSSVPISQDVSPFGFQLPIASPFGTDLSSSKCHKRCIVPTIILANAAFVRSRGAPLDAPLTFPITATSSTVVGATITLPPLTLAGITGASVIPAGDTAGTGALPSVFCAPTLSGCIPVNPAIILTDQVNIVVDLSGSAAQYAAVIPGGLNVFSVPVGFGTGFGSDSGFGF
jgi:hypothetical protein